MRLAGAQPGARARQLHSARQPRRQRAASLPRHRSRGWQSRLGRSALAWPHAALARRMPFPLAVAEPVAGGAAFRSPSGHRCPRAEERPRWHAAACPKSPMSPAPFCPPRLLLRHRCDPAPLHPPTLQRLHHLQRIIRPAARWIGQASHPSNFPMYPSIWPSIYPSIHPSTNLSIYPSLQAWRLLPLRPWPLLLEGLVKE